MELLLKLSILLQNKNKIIPKMLTPNCYSLQKIPTCNINRDNILVSSIGKPFKFI